MSKYRKRIKAVSRELFLRPRPVGITKSNYDKDQWDDYYCYLWDKMTETWAMKVENLHSLERMERMMVRWMCSVTLKNRVPSANLYSRLGIHCVADVVRRGRLRWFGHVERKSVDDWVKACRGVEVVGVRGRGRGRKTWLPCVRQDMELLGLRQEWTLDLAKWRRSILGQTPNPSLAWKK